MRGLIPSALLPALPRAQYTLEPLTAAELIGHMSVLKEMYMPPIHGGFTAGDIEIDAADECEDADADQTGKPMPLKKKRTMSGGSVDLMPGLGLKMEGLSMSKGAIAEEDGAEDDGGYHEYEDDDTDDDADDDDGHNDPFERDWAEKWLNGVVRRAQTWIEAEGAGHDGPRMAEYEAVLREATAVLAMMAGTSAPGSVTRHLLFPLAGELSPALRRLRPVMFAENPNLSPETGRFLASLATSPVSPIVPVRGLPAAAHSPGAGTGVGRSPAADRSVGRRRGSSNARRRPAAVPVLLHDGPMMDHLSVGVQTWGSAILLGREMALRPADFGLFPPPTGHPHGGGTRVLELGAGTGLLSILCRKLLDLRAAAGGGAEEVDAGVVVATDFLPSVLDNLRVCVDLNAPPDLAHQPAMDGGITIAKLDWTTFPAWMEEQLEAQGHSYGPGVGHGPAREIDFTGLPDEDLGHAAGGDGTGASVVPYDLVLASDCVYDITHAAMLRANAGWVLRLPDPRDPESDAGGTFHVLSPTRPTFTPELESIDLNFPTLASYAPLAERAAAAAAAKNTPEGIAGISDCLRGEGMGAPLGLRLGVRGTGKRAVRGRRGEGRVDEEGGYWWWEIGWG